MRYAEQQADMQGFYVLFRSGADTYTPVRWYFSHPSLPAYMPTAVGRQWDQATVGVKLEAFAIAGFEPASKCPVTIQDERAL